MVALGVIDPQSLERLERARILDALGDGLLAERVGDPDDRSHDLFIGRAVVVTLLFPPEAAALLMGETRASDSVVGRGRFQLGGLVSGGTMAVQARLLLDRCRTRGAA